MVEDGMASAEGMNQSCRLSGPRQGSTSGFSAVPEGLLLPSSISTLSGDSLWESRNLSTPRFPSALRPIMQEALRSDGPLPSFHWIPRACPTLRLCSGGAARGNILTVGLEHPSGRSTLSTRRTLNPARSPATARWAPLGPSSEQPRVAGARDLAD